MTTATSPSRNELLRVTPVVIGDPEDTRVREYAGELYDAGFLSPRIVPYHDWLEDPTRAAQQIPRGAHVRLESPGRGPATYRSFLRRGAAAAAASGVPFVLARDASAIELPRGILGWPRQWFHGLTAAMGDIACALEEREAWPSIDPAAVVLAFDKARTTDVLARSGIPVPPTLGAVAGYEELDERMQSAALSRVFVKLAHGSAGAGIVAIARCRTRIHAWTTVQVARVRGKAELFNTRRIRKLHSVLEVARVVDALAPHGVVVEQWIPKAGRGDRCFDLRVVAVAGRARQVVMRWSRTPITNLHLLNERGDPSVLRATMGEAPWSHLLTAAEGVAGIFGRPLHLGIDIAVTPGLRRHVVLEVNAFGDFVRGALHRGRTTHQTEVDVLLEGA